MTDKYKGNRFFAQNYLLIIVLAILALLILVTWYKSSHKSTNKTFTLVTNPALNKNLPIINPVKLSAPPLNAESINIPQEKWHSITIRPGQTISSIFQDLGLNEKQLSAILSLPDATKILLNLVPKQELNLEITTNGKLLQLTTPVTLTKTLIISSSNGKFKAKVHQTPLQVRYVHLKGIIENSIITTITKNEIPNEIMLQMGKIFTWKLNFKRDLREGDTFNIIYSEYFLNNKLIRIGEIIAIKFHTHKGNLSAIRYVNNQGKIEYLSSIGLSLREPFLRFPLHFTRISSPFSLHGRFHPILHIYRPHLGVDLAAPRGTPIHAVADGRIIFRGRRGGYGNAIIVDHGHGYTTLYAHMSRFKRGEHVGSHVQEGQTIGFVGATGLATGPHCHFEFRINGMHYNPVKVHLPDARPLPRKERVDFLNVANFWLVELNQNDAYPLQGPHLMALNHVAEAIGISEQSQ